MLAQTSIIFLFLSFIARILFHPAASDADILLNENGTSRVLLLTAHPDDECLFFAPTVSSLQALAPRDGLTAEHLKVELYSLCLSVGNADGLGETRREELSRSLDVLGIDEDKRWVVDHP
jgi:N-acetylglucosaminylphosphatidylinositol deacetylase